MSALTRNWIVGMVVGTSLLIYGWHVDSTWSIAAAALVFLLFWIERWDNLRRYRSGGDPR